MLGLILSMPFEHLLTATEQKTIVATPKNIVTKISTPAVGIEIQNV